MRQASIGDDTVKITPDRYALRTTITNKHREEDTTPQGTKRTIKAGTTGTIMAYDPDSQLYDLAWNGGGWTRWTHEEITTDAVIVSVPVPHATHRAGCENCGRTWAIDTRDDEPLPNPEDGQEVQPLDGDWYARLDPDGIVPMGECPECQAFVYFQPSQWIPRPVPRLFFVLTRKDVIIGRKRNRDNAEALARKYARLGAPVTITRPDGTSYKISWTRPRHKTCRRGHVFLSTGPDSVCPTCYR